MLSRPKSRSSATVTRLPVLLQQASSFSRRVTFELVFLAFMRTTFTLPCWASSFAPPRRQDFLEAAPAACGCATSSAARPASRSAVRRRETDGVIGGLLDSDVNDALNARRM